MKKRVFVLMATYNHNESSGGSIARKTVEMLCKKVSEVIVITVGEFDIYKKDNFSCFHNAAIAHSLRWRKYREYRQS